MITARSGARASTKSAAALEPLDDPLSDDPDEELEESEDDPLSEDP